MATLYIKEQGAFLRKEQERLIVTRGDERLIEVPVIKVDRVILMGRGVQVTSAALTFLAQRGIPVFFTTKSGSGMKLSIVPRTSGNIQPLMAQVRWNDTPMTALPLVKGIVAGKLYNQAALLATRSEFRGTSGLQAVEIMERLRREVPQATTADQTRGYEGAGAAAYWRAWSAILGDWGFTGRNYYPPTDPINAMLSFGYTMLLQETMAAVQMAGLDPYLGFFHVIEFGRPSLALDLEEEFRPLIVDELVLRLVQTRTINKQQHFMTPPDHPAAIYLNDAGRERFIAAYEEWSQERIYYPYSQPEPTQETWRRCIVLQSQQLARVIQGQELEYQPLIWPR